MHNDQRRFPRRKVRIKARYQSARSEIESTITSISEEGLFLYSTRLDPEGTMVRLEFTLEGIDHTVLATGEVIYIGFQDGLRGMGIKFNRLGTEERAAVLRLVQSA